MVTPGLSLQKELAQRNTERTLAERQVWTYVMLFPLI